MNDPKPPKKSGFPLRIPGIAQTTAPAAPAEPELRKQGEKTGTPVRPQAGAGTGTGPGQGAQNVQSTPGTQGTMVRPSPALHKPEGFRRPSGHVSPTPAALMPEVTEEHEEHFVEPIMGLQGTGLESIETVLMDAVEKRASDVILTAYTEPVLKIYGKTVRLPVYDILSAEDITRLCNQVMTAEQFSELEEHKQIDFSIEASGYRWRVNVAGQRHSYFMTMRIIPTQIKTMEEMMLPKKLMEICQRTRGLILVTGPTGSGKSTTQASMINFINRTMARHIVTIEDPIEFMHDNIQSVINQREIGTDAPSFKLALRAVLRQAPDVILVGELRDVETMEAAISAAETGHLVMGTLHTNSAVGTVDRIIDAFPEGARDQIRVQLANNLICVMSQTLVPRADGNGRIMAYELMLQHTAISSAIREGTTTGIYDTINASGSEGMMSLDKMLLRLVGERVITDTVAASIAIDKKEFEHSLKSLRGG